MVHCARENCRTRDRIAFCQDYSRFYSHGSLIVGWKTQELSLDFYKWHKVTLRELQSIIGLLNFTCSVVLPGRAFLRRLIDLSRGIQRPHFKICFKQRRQKRFNRLAIILGAIQWSHIFSGWTNVRSTIWNYFRCSQFQNVLIFIFT